MSDLKRHVPYHINLREWPLPPATLWLEHKTISATPRPMLVTGHLFHAWLR